jgi:two-component system, NtrC family, sensor kinase
MTQELEMSAQAQLAELQIAELQQTIAQLKQEVREQQVGLQERDRRLKEYAQKEFAQKEFAQKEFAQTRPNLPDLESSAEIALQQALLESEYQSLLLHAIVDSSPDWIFIKDQQYRYILANQSYARQMGKSVSELVGMSDLDLFPEEMVLGNPEKGIHGFRTDDSVVLAGEVVYNPHDVVAIAEGEVKIFDTQKFPLRGNEGDILGVIGISRDITDRQAIGAALAESEQRFRLLVESAQDLIWVLDAEGRYKFLNGATRTMLGYEPEEMLGNLFTKYLAPEEAEKSAQEFQRILQAGSTFQYESAFVAKDGRVVNTSVSAVVIHDDQGSVVEMIGTMSDISDRKRSEIQLRQQTQQLEKTLAELQSAQSHLVQSEKMSSLGQLVAGVAHEINNPVNFIYANLNYANDYIQDLLKVVEIYQRYYPDPSPELQAEVETVELEFLMNDLPKLFTSMKVGADRIQKIVLSLRNFSRMDEAEYKPVDIHEGIDSTLMILQNRTKPRPEHPGIRINRDYEDLPQVECYAGQLNQVFMNIFSNAIDALEERDSERSLHEMAEAPSIISVHTEITDNNRVLIRIVDNGTGIPESVRQRIFDPFFTTKPVGKGTGMGLAISYQVITEKHGGTLKCLSTPGQGTEFVIEIPIRVTPAIAHPDDPTHTPHSPYMPEPPC